MADFVFNVAKGRVVELHNRVDTNDPTNSAIIVVPIDAGVVSDATLKDCDTLAAVLALVTERSTGGWGRKVLTDSDLATISPDDTNDRNPVALPSLTWPAVSAGAVTDLLVCYDPDTTGGTDSAIIPMMCHDYPTTPDGSDIVTTAGDYFRAS